MIFHIGLHKTGTTSLAKALEILGYEVCNNCGELNAQITSNLSAHKDPLTFISDYDAIVDNQALWQYFDQIYKAYPNAYYIHTDRNIEDWLESRKEHVINNQNNPDYTGSFLEVDIPSWRDRKRQHDQRIAKFRKINDVNFLSLNICDEPGDANWQKLCQFLDKEIPTISFPHKNKTTL